MDLGGVGVGRGVGGGGAGGGGGSGDEGVATAEAAVWWGPKAAVVAAAAASASADVMNQLCRVCGEPAAGFHFGAFTCEGCKSFFGRTYSNLSSISECKNNGECVINKKNRTSCKACRLRKCLLVGMSKSGSRYGRRSNWFKIHCLLQEQQQQQQQQQQVASSISGGTGTTHTGTKSNPNQLWSTKSLSGAESPKGFHLEQNSLAASPSPTRVPPVSLPQPLSVAGFPADAAAAASAAAFWAQARGSLLQLPSPHLSALPMPFLTPPFLHGASFNPYQHKGFLLPFLPPATGPGSASPAAATLTLRPSRPTSPASRTIPSAAFSDGKRSPSSSDERESAPPSPPTPPATSPPAPVTLPVVIRPQPPVAPTLPATASGAAAAAAKAAAVAAAAAATALAVDTLRALGPMQDHPLDLSVRGMNAMEGSTRTSSNDCVMTEDSEELSEEEDIDRDSQDEDAFSEELMGADDVNADGQKGSALGGTTSVKRTTPLDLTTHA